MDYQRFIRWVLSNLDSVPDAVDHARQVWDAISAGNEAAAIREAGEFMIWFSAILETMPEYSSDGLIASDYQTIEAAEVKLDDVIRLWDLIRLLTQFWSHIKDPVSTITSTPQ